MTADKRYLAFDLGAESGRAITGSLEEDTMRLDILHRFETGGLPLLGTTYWDILGIFRELQKGLALSGTKYGDGIAGIGIDSWGVDFGLLDADGRLIGNPVHYRDARNNGMDEELFKSVERKRVYETTGIQIMQFNTLFQLFGMMHRGEEQLKRASTMLCIADLLNYFFTGEKVAEFSLATTTQMYNPVESDWAAGLLKDVGIPLEILPDVVAPGSVVGVLSDVVARKCGVKQVPIIAPACHDTGSAIAAVPAEGDDWLYLSSGTWSLLGVELQQPVISARSFELNFTNEGGVDGTYRFLKNIMGLWLVQECRREWERQGSALDYDEITRLASEAPPLKYLLNPNDTRFIAPENMPEEIAAACREAGGSVPENRGEIIRTCLESLALIYRKTAEEIMELTGRTFSVIHIVGGGCQNRLLNQFAADAMGMVVKAGPVEATAFGNCLMQGIGLGDIGSLEQARNIVRKSSEIEIFEPSSERSQWEVAYTRFLEL